MDRRNYNKCGESDFDAFINNIGHSGKFSLRAHNPADKNVMQDRYTFAYNGMRISVVYETKSQTLIVTAPPELFDELERNLPASVKPKPQGNSAANKGNAQPQSNSVAQPKPLEEQKPQNKQSKAQEDAKPQAQKPTQQKPQGNSAANKGNAQPQSNLSAPKQQGNVQSQPNSPAPKQQGNAQPKGQSNLPATKQHGNLPAVTKPHEEAKPQPQKQQSKAHEESGQKSQPQKQQTQRSNKQPKSHEVRQKKAVPAFEIKNVTNEKLEELLKKIRAAKMRYKTTKDHSGKKFKITAQNQNAELEFSGGSLSLYGDKSNLLSELQLMISQVSDYKTAINSHIKSVKEDRRAGEVERQLKKKLPAAFEFLSEQSKIDLAIAIIDINNSAVVLSDYSTLLIPCFRGLERLIFDLQHAQGIVVKMIGQAYEKEDGNYVLKSGYRRKIPSVVYAEVMASLYTEYFKQRNFYAHSDGGYDNLSRVITDKQQVISIFNHILDVINYNGKKLKEIGFRIV